MAKIIKSLLALFLFTSIQSNAADEARTYDSMQDFVTTLPMAKLLEIQASGAIADRKSTYHAQLVELENYTKQQIFVFRLNNAGKYILIDQTKIMDSMGGSGNWRVSNIEFRNLSLYISFGYQWHQCQGWSTNQFQFINNQLAMIGSESEEESFEKRLRITSSLNLLTGKGYWIRAQKGTGKKHWENSMKGVRPFSEYDGSGWISPYNTKHPVC